MKTTYDGQWIVTIQRNENIDKTNTENDCARAFAYLENKYTFILIVMI
jgi:hypothetical protein